MTTSTPVNTKVELSGKAEMKSASTGDVRLSLVVSPALNGTLEDLAEKMHSTKSEVLRKAIALYEVAAEAKLRDQKMGILDKDDNLLTKIVGI
jgi:predicted transcriptional regulator